MDKTKIKKLVRFIVISFILYFLFPYLLVTILSATNIISVRPSFFVALIIVAVIGGTFAVVQKVVPKNTLSFHIISIFNAAYFGIYFFYVFGGFAIDRTLEEYYIQNPNAIIYLGLQVFAWLLLIAALAKIVIHIIYIIEIKIDKQIISQIRKNARYGFLGKVGSILIDNLYTIINLVTLAFIITIMINGANVQIFYNLEIEPQWDYQGDPSDPNNYMVNITLNFDMVNNGFFTLEEVHARVGLFTLNTSDSSQTELPDNTKVGELRDLFLDKFASYTTITGVILVVEINSTYSPGLAAHNATLQIAVYMMFRYAGVMVRAVAFKEFIWVKLIP